MVGTLADRLAQLAQAFNERRLDVPPGLIDRGCVFRLNGVAYEDTMGRPVSDPIVRLVARGPAAYRFLAQAMRYALPDARVAVEDVEPGDASPGQLASATASVEGTLRGQSSPFRTSVALALVIGEHGLVRELAAMMDEQHVDAIREARQR